MPLCSSKPASWPAHGAPSFVPDEPPEYETEERVACGCLRERALVRQQWRHALFAASRVVAVDDVAERVQAGVLPESHPDREAPRLDRNPAADGVEDQAERRAVQRMQGEPRSTPVATPRHSFAEHGDVRVVAAKETAVDRLEQSPDSRRGGPCERGS
jgi:hypothetical protein